MSKKFKLFCEELIKRIQEAKLEDENGILQFDEWYVLHKHSFEDGVTMNDAYITYMKLLEIGSEGEPKDSTK